MTMADYHAYFTTRTHVFDLHVSRMSEKDMEPLPRAEFERIVKSIRVLALRRGWTEDYPPQIAVPMTLASVMGVTNEPWAKKYMTEHADEWPAHFANAEYLRFAQAPTDAQITAYEKALALIAKAEKPDEKVRFTTAILYDGLSLALYDANKYADTIAPIEKSLAILEELKRKERAGLAYNLACSQALTKHAPEALAALKKAIDADPRYKESAAKDADFDFIKNDPAFQALIGKAAAPPAKK
jgi:tetratricopeptide (TPR) repeat protein